MMETDASRQQTAFSFRDGGKRRPGTSTVLLGIGAGWLLAMAYLLYLNLPERHVIPLFLFIAVALSITAWASVRTGEWDRNGQLLLWWTFGSTLSIWMFGIFSIGWLFLPALLLELIALIAWPRPKGTSIVTRAGMIAEVVGFLSTPAVFALGIFIAGGM